MTFEEYWTGYWKPTGQPAVFDAAMKEIAEKAWNAAIESAALVSIHYDEYDPWIEPQG